MYTCLPLQGKIVVYGYVSTGNTYLVPTKGQINSKADWSAVDSPKKRTNEFVLFAFLLFTANKTNSFVRFWGESTAHPNCFWFHLTFKLLTCDQISELLLISGPRRLFWWVELEKSDEMLLLKSFSKSFYVTDPKIYPD